MADQQKIKLHFTVEGTTEPEMRKEVDATIMSLFPDERQVQVTFAWEARLSETTRADGGQVISRRWEADVEAFCVWDAL